jgi:hypothetical protein
LEFLHHLNANKGEVTGRGFHASRTYEMGQRGLGRLRNIPITDLSA